MTTIWKVNFDSTFEYSSGMEKFSENHNLTVLVGTVDQNASELKDVEAAVTGIMGTGRTLTRINSIERLGVLRGQWQQIFS